MAKKKTTLKTKEERTQYKEERELSDIRCVAKTPEGRRFLWKQLEQHDIFRENDIIDQTESNRFEGRRNIGIRLLNKLTTAKPSLLGQMQEEHASELKREEIEILIEEEQSDSLSLD